MALVGAVDRVLIIRWSNSVHHLAQTASNEFIE